MNRIIRKNTEVFLGKAKSKVSALPGEFSILCTLTPKETVKENANTSVRLEQELTVICEYYFRI